MKRSSVFILLLFLFLFISGHIFSSEAAEDLFRITVLDVGKGDCILVETGDNIVMNDTGYKNTAEDVLKYLQDRNISKLDALIISHYHKDHVGGGAAVLQNLIAEKIYMPDYEGTREVYFEMLTVIEEKGLSPQRIKGSDGIVTFRLESGAEYRIFPSTVPYDPEEENDNDVSMTAAVYYNGHSAFFAGDLEEAGITSLSNYANGQDLSCDILKLPHHGRTSDNSSVLFDLIHPQTALITDGSSQRAYGEMIDMLKERNITTLCSAADKTYIITASGPSGCTIERTGQTEPLTSGPWEYMIENGNAVITGYTGIDTELNIPSGIEGCPVTGIADSAFYNHTKLTSVTVPETVSSIGDSAFSWCSKLKTISLPDQPVSLGAGAFSWCEKLESVTLPTGINSIGEYTFFHCKKLSDTTIPESVTTIGEKAFAHCNKMESVTIPSGVKSIDEEAFQKCKNLKTVLIQPGLKTIKKSMFSGCENLESVTIPSTVKSIKTTVFDNCNKLADIFFEGTEEMWEAIEKADKWNEGMPAGTKIHFQEPPAEPFASLTFFPMWSPGSFLPATGITAEVIFPKSADLKYQKTGLTIEIPSVSSAAEIVEVPLTDKEYPVTRLGSFAGLLQGFSFPGEGTSMIVGHNHLDQQKAGPFAMLKSVGIGDRIFVRSEEREKVDIFSVFANERISKTDIAALGSIAASGENVLILMTCEDERIDGGYENRRILAAVPVL